MIKMIKINFNTNKSMFYLLCGYAFFSTMSIAVINVFLGLALLLAVISLIKEKININWIPKAYLKAFIVFVVSLIIVAVFSEDILLALRRAWKYIYKTMPFFLVVLFIRDKKQILILLNLLFVSLLASDIHAICDGLSGTTRATGFDGYIMQFATYILLLLPMILIGIYQVKNRFAKIYLILLFLISFLAILYNASRFAWIILMVLLPIITCMYYRNIKRVLPYILTAFFVVVVIIGTNPYFAYRIGSVFDPLDTSNSCRVLIWKQAWSDFENSPIVGNNFGQYTLATDVPISLEPGNVTDVPISLEPGNNEGITRVTYFHAHNNFLQMLAESGIVGCIGYSFLMFSLIFYTFKEWRQRGHFASLMMFAGTMGIFAQGLTDFSFGFNLVMKMYFFILGLYIVYLHHPSNNVNS